MISYLITGAIFGTLAGVSLYLFFCFIGNAATPKEKTLELRLALLVGIGSSVSCGFAVYWIVRGIGAVVT